jgi:hypothetical protein
MLARNPLGLDRSCVMAASLKYDGQTLFWNDGAADFKF